MLCELNLADIRRLFLAANECLLLADFCLSRLAENDHWRSVAKGSFWAVCDGRKGQRAGARHRRQERQCHGYTVDTTMGGSPHEPPDDPAAYQVNGNQTKWGECYRQEFWPIYIWNTFRNNVRTRFATGPCWWKVNTASLQFSG